MDTFTQNDDKEQSFYLMLSKNGNSLYKYILNLLNNGEKEFVKNHLEEIAKTTTTPIKMLTLLKGFDLDYLTFKRLISDKKDIAIKEMLSGFGIAIDFDDPSTQKSIDTIINMIDKITQYQNLDFFDIVPLGSGGSSNAFLLGDKIIKIGTPAETQNIPRNCSRFLQPIVRSNFDVKLTNQEEYKINFQMTEVCDVKKDFSEDEIYEVYKDIRKAGMIWTDCASSNIGILKKPNKLHTPGEAHHSNVGFGEESNKFEVLPAGKLVLIDLDYIYDENDPNIVYPDITGICAKMEARYQKELEKSKAKNFEFDH